jgi:hypothetical protein
LTKKLSQLKEQKNSLLFDKKKGRMRVKRKRRSFPCVQEKKAIGSTSSVSKHDVEREREREEEEIVHEKRKINHIRSGTLFTLLHPLPMSIRTRLPHLI